MVFHVSNTFILGVFKWMVPYNLEISEIRSNNRRGTRRKSRCRHHHDQPPLLPATTTSTHHHHQQLLPPHQLSPPPPATTISSCHHYHQLSPPPPAATISSYHHLTSYHHLHPSPLPTTTRYHHHHCFVNNFCMLHLCSGMALLQFVIAYAEDTIPLLCFGSVCVTIYKYKQTSNYTKCSLSLMLEHAILAMRAVRCSKMEVESCVYSPGGKWNETRHCRC
jgi:hypothetical protein